MANTILVVDDEPDLELLITQRFRKEIRDKALKFVFASNGQEALAKLGANGDTDVVLTDINMPVMDGLTLLSNLSEHFPLLRAVIVSAYGDMANIRTALNRGAFDFITKPIDFSDLAITLDKTVREASARKQAEANRYRLVALHKELDVARRIQESIVHRDFPPYPARHEFAVHASMRPARAVGGDFYDFFFVDDHHLAFAIGDVTGKGVPAAIFMAVSRTMLRVTGARGLATDACLSLVNDALFAESIASMFVTCFYGVLDTRTGLVEYTNAGHNPPYVLGRDGGITATPAIGGLFLGAFDKAHYKSATVQLEPGDSLVLFTDGISEAANPDDEQYGEARLEACLARLAGAPADQVVASVVADVDAFSAGAAQADDMTTMCLTFNGAPGSSPGSVAS
jgi:sigma-B regulation protein RsbU (phosphoserine phosphatase)